MRFRRLVVVTLAFALASLAFTQQPPRRPITETDIFRFLWVADPQISPDGKRVAFTRVHVDDKGEAYESSLWSVPADGSAAPTRLSSGTRDAQPRWSPDGRRLAFLRAPMKDGKPQPPQIYVMPLNGGEAWQLADVPEGASAPGWSPDGSRIAFLCAANDKDLEKQKKEKAARKRVQDERKKEEEKQPDSGAKAAEGSAKPDAAGKSRPTPPSTRATRAPSPAPSIASTGPATSIRSTSRTYGWWTSPTPPMSPSPPGRSLPASTTRTIPSGRPMARGST